jgi:RNA polymerase sigma factor (sigma-70 family)
VEEIRWLVERSQLGDLDAYGQLVLKLQDMAYGYGYSLLGDFHSAEDAAQEAFIEAYRNLGRLRDPAAFPGWFRRIVFSRCQRLLRRKRPSTIALDVTLVTRESDPSEIAAGAELKGSVLAAIAALSEAERTATTLFYINGYSQEEIAGFLEVPVTTVKNRLYTSRKRLKERMMNMVAEEMRSHSLPEKFPERIRLLLELPRPLEIEGHPVKKMWDLFRSCFPGFEILETEEVISIETPLSQEDHDVKLAYPVDEERMLRTAVTSQLVRRWVQQGGGFCKLITAGRVFRQGEESRTDLVVHHQAEILWSGQGLDERRCLETAYNVASMLLPGIECRQGGSFSYAPVPAALGYEVPWRNRWLGVAAGGMVEKEWLRRMGLDPERDGAISLCFGLDRCAQARYDLDDIRNLWHPPYVPK